ncbi:MAG: 2'-5' RNA ligase family protein, partial [bacterium]|nr:2'-5' RNA ligase family protein [bacterium]
MSFIDDTAKRLFIAIPISQSLQTEIVVWAEKYFTLPVQWLQGKNLHVTLIPPWYEHNLEEVFSFFDSVKGIVRPFEIKFEHISVGPNPHEPRLIWVAGEAPGELLVLKESLEKTFGKKSEHQHFKMHLTLARFRPEDFVLFPKKKI